MTQGKRRRKPTSSRAAAGKAAAATNKATAPPASQLPTVPVEANSFCGPLLREIALEMQAPLSGMSLGTQTLEKLLERADNLDTASLARIASIFRRACQQQRYLVETLLALAQTDSTLAVASLRLDAWVPAALAAEVERARLWHQQVVITLPPDLLPLETNGTILARILTELLAGASAETPLGGEITVAIAQDPATTSVTSSGRAREIDPEILHSLQERERPKPTETGLNLARKLAPLIGGTLLEKAKDGVWRLEIDNQVLPASVTNESDRAHSASGRNHL